MEALRAILDELIAILGPLVDAAQDPDKLIKLLDELGWNASSVPQPLQDLAQVGAELVRFIGSDFESVPATELVNAIKHLIDAINALRNKPDGAFPAGIDVAVFKSTIARDLIDYCFVQYLLSSRQKIGGILRLAGFIKLTQVPAVGLRKAYVKPEVSWSLIGSLLTDPAKGFRDLFAWNSPQPKLAEALANLASLLESYDLAVSYFEPEGSLLTFMNTGATLPFDEPFGIDLAFDETMGAPAGVSLGIQLLLLPPTSSRGIAMAFLPYAKLNGATEIPLSESIALTIRGNADFTKGVAITLAPNHPPEVKSGFLGGSGSIPAQAFIGVKLTPPSGQPDRLLLGTADATRVTIRSASFSVGADLLDPTKIDVLLGLDLDNFRVVIKPSPDDSDSFLATFLGKDGIAAELSLGLQLSSRTGFHLKASGGLEANFPLHIALGPIEFQSLTLALKPSSEGITLETGATIAGKLGPLSAVIENTGFKLTARFPDPPTGNLGPLDLVFGFKPPNGVGLSIDAGPVSGGGYLFFDFDKGEYGGVLQLDLAKIVTVTAIALITTRMPDGSKGFSLLIIITAEFATGIQLGFGFTLLGVGGLLGLNRTMNLQALAEGVRNGALNNIMFPHDVIANAPRIISDLRNFFPAENGKFLIGPMVKLGWGTPTLVSLSLGIIIEIPGNIAIVGILRVALPADDAALIVLQVSFIGALEFDKSRVWFFATLFESRVLFFTLEGDMGLLMAFGDDANFVLSVGGFHPQFNPPPLPFPSPRRIAFSILDSPGQRIRVEAYFAVTSNTVQFGAHAEMVLGFDDFGLEGHIAFDVLIQFSPFYFIAQISASISLKAFGVGLFSVRLSFELSGPSGWRARGSGSISILFFEISADFDISWGDSKDTSLPPIPVIPILTAELNKPENWKAELPATNNLLVALRKLDPTIDTLVLHPVGTLRVSQKAVPLDLGIDKVGNQKPNDAKRFSIEVLAGGMGKAADATEQFAVAQFQNMDDATKLSRPSYQALNGGVQLSVSGQQLKSSHAVRRIVRYEQIIIDNNFKRFSKHFSLFVFGLFDHFLGGASVSKSALSANVKTQYQPFKEKVTVAQEGYTVAHQADNKAYATTTFASEAAARDFMQQAIAEDPNRAEALHVIPQFEVTP